MIELRGSHYRVITCFKKSYNKYRMCFSCKPGSDVALFIEKVYFTDRIGLINLTGEYIRIHGGDIHYICVVGHSTNEE